MSTGTTWAGNYAFRARELHRPGSIADVQRIVAEAPSIRAVGSRHSFNDIADSTAELVTLEALEPAIEIDSERMLVRVGGGVRYGTVATELAAHGYALHNLASLPHISVAGSIATATHGSGIRNGNLATSVAAMNIVTATGDTLSVDRNTTPDFAGMVVALGALGVVTSVTLDIRPTFNLRQRVFENLPWDTLLDRVDDIVSAAYSVSVFTDWRGDTARQVWFKALADDPTAAGDRADSDDFFGARPATGPRHMLPGITAENCTDQLGVPGPWQERLPHFKLGFTPSNGQELQSEYLVPRRHAVAAISAMKELSPLISPLLQIAELRTIAADELWLSTAQGADMLGIHFTWHPDQPAVEAVLPTMEAALAPYDARPHWGKLFCTTHEELEHLYPRLDDFRMLADRLDPHGTFHNAFLHRTIFGE